VEPRPAEDEEETVEQGGETSCYAHLVCEECGALLDGGGHREGCPRAA